MFNFRFNYQVKFQITASKVRRQPLLTTQIIGYDNLLEAEHFYPVVISLDFSSIKFQLQQSM